MSKVICDVCGTACPENAARCPICGCALPAAEHATAQDNDKEETGESGYTYVKGGRFSKANVRKRNKTAVAAVGRKSPPKNVDDDDDDEDGDEDGQEGGSRGLVIAVIVLLLAIIAVAAYIFLRFFNPASSPKPTAPTIPTVTTEPTVATLATDPTVPCAGIRISSDTVTLDKVGRAWLLDVTVSPENTTDKVTYSSSDTKVAAVTPEGRIVAVGPGEAVITITCGNVTKQCKVNCDFGAPLPTVPTPTDPTETPTPTDPTTEEPTEPQNDFSLNRTDFTLFSAGSSHVLYTGDIDLDQITFSSDNESVATFIAGKVVAVGPGTTRVHAEYNGKKVSCIVRCKFTVEEEPTEPNPTEPEPTEPEPTEEPETYSVWINGRAPSFANEATFPISDTFKITLVDSEGKAVDVTWKSSNTDVCTVSGTTVTPVGEGYSILSATYEGREYTFKVIIRDTNASG